MLARTLRRFYAGWQDPGQRRDASRYLIAAAVLLWLSLALVIGTRATPVLISAAVSALASLVCLVGAASALWGRDL
jgi:hypothetical protein